MTLAIAFGNPWMLLALSAGLIPIALHLLRKRKFQETEWAAMRFLQNATRRTSRRVRLEQLVLLVVRVLTLILLAIALARPYSVTSGMMESNRRTHRMLVFDTSYSMGADIAGATRLGKARELAVESIQAARLGDSFQLAQICETSPVEIVREPSVQVAQVVSLVEGLKPTDQKGNVLRTLRSIVANLDELSEDTTNEVVVFTDLQATSWQPVTEAGRRELVSLLQTIAASARLLVVHVGEENPRNAAVTGIAADRSQIVVGEPVRFQVQVRNQSTQAELTTRVRLMANGKIIGSQKLNLIPAKDETATFEHTFDRVGSFRLEAKIDDDAVAVDNVFRQRVDIRDHVEVLLVNGRESLEPSSNATFYLEQALDPVLARRDRARWIQTTVVNPRDLNAERVLNADVVFLCDVSFLGTRDRDLFLTFVRNGGLLVLMPSAQCRIDNYNELLFRQKPALLPAEIETRSGSAIKPERLFRFDTSELRHPILDPYRGNPGLGLERAMTLEYFKLKPEGAPEVDVILPFDSGDPAVIERRLGQGAVLFVASPWDDSRWNTLARRDGDVLVALTHEIVRYGLIRRSRYGSLRVGDAMSIPLGSDNGDIARLRLPDGSFREPDDAGDRLMLQLNADQTGWYELERNGQRDSRETWAVNVDPEEGRLTAVDAEVFRAEFLPDTNTVLINDTGSLNRQSVLPEERSFSLTRWFLYAVLCFVVIEQLLAWRFRYGVLAGLLALCIAAILQPPLGSPLTGWALAVGACAATWYFYRHSLRSTAGA